MSQSGDQLIERFYAAFAARDGDARAACYTPGARFSGSDVRGATGR